MSPIKTTARICLGFAFVLSLSCALDPSVSVSASPQPPSNDPSWARALDSSWIKVGPKPGRPVAIKFFAAFCPACLKILPSLEKLHRQNPNITIIGIDEDESESDAQALVDQFGLTFPVIHDDGSYFARRYRVRELPYVIVLGPDGIVRWQGSGRNTFGDLTPHLQ